MACPPPGQPIKTSARHATDAAVSHRRAGVYDLHGASQMRVTFTPSPWTAHRKTEQRAIRKQDTNQDTKSPAPQGRFAELLRELVELMGIEPMTS